MTREEVFVQLNGVFREVFDDENIVVTDMTTADNIEDWDSLMHISLISAVEDEFSMKFNMKEIVSMKNVGEMVDIIVRELEE